MNPSLKHTTVFILAATENRDLSKLELQQLLQNYSDNQCIISVILQTNMSNISWLRLCKYAAFLCRLWQ